MNDLIKTVKDLSNMFGPSGFEDEVLNYISKRINFLSKTRDSINNLFLGLEEKQSDKPTIALDCHTDEIGFMVENINKNGTISFLQLGGWFSGNIPASPVVIKNSKGEYVKGITTSKPIHFMTEDEMTRLQKIKDLFIDIGTSSLEETKNIYSLDIGCPIVPDVEFIYDDKISIMRGKALDNRLGCASVIHTLEYFKNKEHNFNLIGAMSAQEETGLRGALVSANRIKPDFVIVFEGSPSDDTFREYPLAHGLLGSGVQLRVMDGQHITNHRVLKYVKDIADKNNIKYQVIAREKGSTNAGKYHLAENSIPVIVLGIPARYIHTHYSYASLKDLEASIELAKAVIEDITLEKIKSF